MKRNTGSVSSTLYCKEWKKYRNKKKGYNCLAEINHGSTGISSRKPTATSLKITQAQILIFK